MKIISLVTGVIILIPPGQSVNNKLYIKINGFCVCNCVQYFYNRVGQVGPSSHSSVGIPETSAASHTDQGKEAQ